MKFVFLFISFLFSLNSFAYEELDPPEPPTQKEIEKYTKQAFDTIIDMYMVSTIEEKLDFINSLDDYEIEIFFEYLRENYPKEFEKIP